MKKFSTRNFLALFAMMVLLGNAVYAWPPMKDIELDPDKAVNVGDKLWMCTGNPGEINFNFFFAQDGAVTVKVYDLNGREVLPVNGGYLRGGRTNQCVIEKGDLQNGVYFVKVSHSNGTELVKKFSVMN